MTPFKLVCVLKAPGTTRERLEEHGKDRLACRRLVTAFSHVFHAGDAAELIVLCVDRADLPDVEDWVRRAAGTNAYGRPPAVRVMFGGALDPEVLAGARPVDLGDVQSEEGLFRAYDALQDDMPDHYESERVTDIYDLQRIVEVRRYQPDAEGSVYLNAPRRPRYREYLAWIAARQGRVRVLDVGCGAGALYGVLAGWARSSGLAMPAYVGLDHSRTHILRARRAYPEACFHWGSLVALQTWPGQYDLCVATSVLNFVPPEGQLEGLGRMLAAADGALFTIVNASRPQRYEPIPPRVACVFSNDRQLPSCHADHGALLDVLRGFPGCVVEESRALVGYRRTGREGVVERVDVPLADEAALLARGLDDAQVAAGLRAQHRLAEGEGPFEVASLALWPADARGLPPAPGLPGDLYQERDPPRG